MSLCPSVKFVVYFSHLIVGPNLQFVSEGIGLVECAVSCESRAGCKSFFYDKVSRKCLHHRGFLRDTDRTLVTSSGMVYYISAEGKRCLDKPGYKFKGYGFCVKYFFTYFQTWLSARNICRRDRARLLQIDTAGKDEAIIAIHLRTSGRNIREDFWLGGSDIQQEGMWVWTDGTPVPRGGTPSVYSNWGGKEPDGGWRQNCMFHMSGKWYNGGCDTRKRFMCERSSHNT